MAPKKVEKKQKTKRKSRTEVSDASSSDSEIAASKPAAAGLDESEIVQEDDENHQTDVVATTSKPPKPVKQSPEEAFESFYVQQATKEFADDLDKLRSAGDFKDGSLEVLIAALKQGTACFSREERMAIGEAALGGWKVAG